jgi:hypothetical protein
VVFLLSVAAFIGCACLVVPLVAVGILAAKDRRDRARQDRERARLSLPSTDGVR